MKKSATVAMLLIPLLIAACGKKAPEATPEAAPAPVAAAPVAAAPAAEPAELSAEQREKAEKQAALDYATMEDKFMNDPRGQWASGANASSTFGGEKASESNLPARVVGGVDGDDWTNNNQDIGFDWLELSYQKPVNATEVRLVVPGGEGVEAISKVELQDTDGKWITIWSGISDVKRDKRGARTWFVRAFDKTPYKVKGVKYTFANNVERGYKNADAAQLVGD